MTTNRVMTALAAAAAMVGLAFLVAMAWSVSPPSGGWWAPWAISALAVLAAAMVVVLVIDEWRHS